MTTTLFWDTRNLLMEAVDILETIMERGGIKSLAPGDIEACYDDKGSKEELNEEGFLGLNDFSKPEPHEDQAAVDRAFECALAAATDQKKVLYFGDFPLVESAVVRSLLRQAGIPEQKLLEGALEGKDVTEILKIAETMSNLPLYVADDHDYDVDVMNHRIAIFQRNHRMDMLVIDRLRKVKSSRVEYYIPGDERLKVAVEELQTLAHHLGVPCTRLFQ